MVGSKLPKRGCGRSENRESFHVSCFFLAASRKFLRRCNKMRCDIISYDAAGWIYMTVCAFLQQPPAAAAKDKISCLLACAFRKIVGEGKRLGVQRVLGAPGAGSNKHRKTWKVLNARTRRKITRGVCVYDEDLSIHLQDLSRRLLLTTELHSLCISLG